MGKYPFSDKQDARREERRTMKATKKIKLTPLPKLKERATKTFNSYIRNRDAGLPCISCGNSRELQAGHYVPEKQSSFLRYHEWNVNGECGGCNCFDAFHLIGYRKRLIDKIGLKAVEWLEDNKSVVKKWTRNELEAIIEKYKAAKGEAA